MQEAFDPYRKWLGISPKDQPPNHYRLLGIDPFEPDLDTIENAADQRMAHVRRFQSGRHSVLSQRILNELAAARVCLLNADKKAAYDETLRRSLVEAQPSPPPAPEVATLPDVLDGLVPPESRASPAIRQDRWRRKASLRAQLFIAGAIVVAAALLLVVAVLIFGGPDDGTATSTGDAASPELAGDNGPVAMHAVAEPRRAALTELNTPDTDAYPWVSPDGLTIYWTREGGSQQSSSIWTATRRDPNSEFENASKVIEGRQAVFSADQLEVLLLAGSPPQTLHHARRSSTDRSFPQPQAITQFRAEPGVKSPFLSPDGRALLFQRRGSRPGSTEFALAARPSPTAQWSAMHVITMLIDRQDFPEPLTWPSMTSDRLKLLFCHGGDKTPEIMIGSRETTSPPFGHFRVVTIDGKPLIGRCPRYVDATGDLFYCATPSPPSDDWDLWVVRGFELE